MKIVADTDILSIFARIKRLDILSKMFDTVLISPSVRFELNRGGIDIRKLNHVFVTLQKDELKELGKAPSGLDRGERECYVVAKRRNLPLASNETLVSRLCKKENIGYLSLPRILRFAISENLITRYDAKRLVNEIENEEHTVIKNKEEIFK